MSTILRSAATMFLGFPPVFLRVRRNAPRPRIEPVVEPVPVPKKRGRGVDVQKILAATRSAAPVELSIIEWDGDAQVASTAENDPAAEDSRTGEAKLRRIRDRYIGARFPGVARSASDLEQSARVVKAARLYFEDGQAETALELLDLAIAQDSRAEALWLAHLEILFLLRNASRFVETARAFHALHPASASWEEIARLGRALVPGETLFGAASAPRTHEHYGPWPDLPNWIQADWDLTAEVAAADFHRILTQRAA